MSYSVYLTIDTGSGNMAEVSSIGNLTWNLSPMHSLAGCWMKDFEGKTAKDSIEKLEKGIADMKADPGKYKVLNPANGWGKL